MALLVQHILRHKSGRISFRRHYPVELRPFMSKATGTGGPWVLKRSLGYEGAPGFLSRYEAAMNDWETEVALARKRQAGAYDKLDSPAIAYLAETFRVERLQQDEEARWDAEERAVVQSVAASLPAHGAVYRPPWADNPARRWSMKARETIEASLPEYRRLRAEGDLEGIVSEWRDEALDLAEARGLVIDETDEAGLLQLCRALNDAAIAADDDRLRRLGGEDVPTPPEPAPESAKQPPPPRSPVKAHVPLLTLYDSYTSTHPSITPGVKIEWRRYIKKLIAFLGHDDAARLTEENLRDWRDRLLEEPIRGGKLRSPVTVRDKYITSIRVTLAYAVEERLLPENVAAAVKVRQPKKVKLRDRSFTPEEARTILWATMSPMLGRMSPEHARARRWVPWLCAYTGARVGEMAQLRGQDVLQLEGVWCLRITPDAGTVKAKKFRDVPLHPHLIEQGFLAMVKAIGPGPLFYDPARRRADGDDNRHVKKVGERLRNWVREDLKITDEGLQPNHGWRHLFKSLSYEAGIEERMADAIQGHAPVTTGRTYGAPSIAAKAEAIARLPRFEIG